LLEHARDVTARAGGVVIDRERWRRAVGERIAARTEPGRLRNGTLTVHVASAAWAQELSFFTRELLERVTALGVAATALRFQVRPSAAHAVPVSTPKPTVARAPLPRELEERLAGISDPSLRAAIAEAAALGLAAARLSSKPRARAPRAAAARNAPPGRATPAPPRGPQRKP
jgi:hypothetical protein